MALADLSQVLSIQQCCYPPAYHEPQAAFENKLRCSTESAWLAVSGEEVQAYLVTLPVDEAHFPALHATNWVPPQRAKWLYLHDLAVAPMHRGGGAGQRLIAQALSRAQALGLEGLALVAVQGSQPYWARQGFHEEPVSHDALREALRTFGDDAVFMMRR